MSKPSLCFVVPAHGRHAIAEVCLRQLRRTCDALAHRGIYASAVVIANDANLELAGSRTSRRSSATTRSSAAASTTGTSSPARPGSATWRRSATTTGSTRTGSASRRAERDRLHPPLRRRERDLHADVAADDHVSGR
jgi:hypothetical protein